MPTNWSRPIRTHLKNVKQASVQAKGLQCNARIWHQKTRLSLRFYWTMFNSIHNYDMLRLFVVTTQTQLSAPTVPPRSDSISRAAPSDRNNLAPWPVTCSAMHASIIRRHCLSDSHQSSEDIVSPIHDSFNFNFNRSLQGSIHGTRLL